MKPKIVLLIAVMAAVGQNAFCAEGSAEEYAPGLYTNISGAKDLDEIALRTAYFLKELIDRPTVIGDGRKILHTNDDGLFFLARDLHRCAFKYLPDGYPITFDVGRAMAFMWLSIPENYVTKENAPAEEIGMDELYRAYKCAIEEFRDNWVPKTNNIIMDITSFIKKDFDQSAGYDFVRGAIGFDFAAMGGTDTDMLEECCLLFNDRDGEIVLHIEDRFIKEFSKHTSIKVFGKALKRLGLSSELGV